MAWQPACSRAFFAHQRQQSPAGPASCFGGHTALPYEQNTQQSPATGRNTTWQCVHS